jgi:hypothetical protein
MIAEHWNSILSLSVAPLLKAKTKSRQPPSEDLTADIEDLSHKRAKKKAI